MTMETKKTLQAVVWFLVAAAIGFIVYTVVQFYLNAGPGSGHHAIRDYVTGHIVQLGATVALAATLVLGGAGYLAWRGRHILQLAWDDLRKIVSGE